MTRLEALAQEPQAVWWAAGALAFAVALAAWVFLVPSRSLPMERRRFGVTPEKSALTRATDSSTYLIAKMLRQRDRLAAMTHALDLAGIRRSVPELVLLTGAAALAAAAIGALAGGLPSAVLLAGMTVAGAVAFVALRASRRRAAFADQLDDMVQLLGSNMRAGHSLLQGLDSVARELEEPGASEISRVVNQVRVGRDLGEAMEETAERMASDDFRWVSEAIAIHRQVGGNLADVLDTVGATIRERNQVRRQVRALSAEGRMSAYILIALPIVVALAMSVLNPTYIGQLTQSAVGYLMILAAVTMLVAGAIWLFKTVKFTF